MNVFIHFCLANIKQKPKFNQSLENIAKEWMSTIFQMSSKNIKYF